MTWRPQPGLRFIGGFLFLIACFSAVLQVDAFDRAVVTPLTGVITRVSSVILDLLGTTNEVHGTVILGREGFAVNIQDGCNGVYVTAIVIAAVIAFPSAWREKAVGLLICVAGVHMINIVRIVTLYWIGLTRPDWFEHFHYYVWQTGVIIVSMAIWILWADRMVRRPGTTPTHRGTPAAGNA